MRYLDLNIRESKADGYVGVLFDFDGKTYFADKWKDQEPLRRVRFDKKQHCYVTDGVRDFGGCGKDAVKLEVGVPFLGWMHDKYIIELVCRCCGDPSKKRETFDRKLWMCESCGAE